MRPVLAEQRRALRRSVLLVRGAQENAHDALLESRLRVSQGRQATLALATAGERRWQTGGEQQP